MRWRIAGMCLCASHLAVMTSCSLVVARVYLALSLVKCKPVFWVALTNVRVNTPTTQDCDNAGEHDG